MKHVLIAVALCFAFVETANAHCQVPCGIYGDRVKFEVLKEHAKTIEKAVAEINKLSRKGKKEYNQIIRWVDNKEKHAQAIQQEMLDYFLAQRIKTYEADPHYSNMLKAVHEVIVKAMKTKQSADADASKQLTYAVDKLQTVYHSMIKKNKTK